MRVSNNLFTLPAINASPIRVEDSIPVSDLSLAQDTIMLAQAGAEVLPADTVIQPTVLNREMRRIADGESFLNYPQQPCSPFMVARARYNLTNNLSAFNNYLPLRRSLQGNARALRDYDRLVNDIISRGKVNIQWCNFNSITRGYDNLALADSSLQHFIVAQIVEGLYHRPELLNRILDRDNKLTIRLCRNAIHRDGPGGGFYQSRDNTIAMSVNSFSALANDSFRFTLMHELAHAMDCGDPLEIARVRVMPRGFDGTLHGMTDGQKATLTRERERLFGIYNRTPAERIVFGLPINNNLFSRRLSGLREYTFTNNVEFLADTVAYFFTQPERLREASRALYDLYCEYFRVNPIEIRRAPARPIRMPMLQPQQRLELAA